MINYFSYEDYNGIHVFHVEDIWDIAEGVPAVEIDIRHALADINAAVNGYDRADWERVANADTSYPIIAFAPQGNTIMDGYHRVMKRVMEGHTTVMVQLVHKLPKECARFKTWEAFAVWFNKQVEA